MDQSQAIVSLIFFDPYGGLSIRASQGHVGKATGKLLSCSMRFVCFRKHSSLVAIWRPPVQSHSTRPVTGPGSAVRLAIFRAMSQNSSAGRPRLHTSPSGKWPSCRLGRWCIRKTGWFPPGSHWCGRPDFQPSGCPMAPPVPNPASQTWGFQSGSDVVEPAKNCCTTQAAKKCLKCEFDVAWDISSKGRSHCR